MNELMYRSARAAGILVLIITALNFLRYIGGGA